MPPGRKKRGRDSIENPKDEESPIKETSNKKNNNDKNNDINHSEKNSPEKEHKKTPQEEEEELKAKELDKHPIPPGNHLMVQYRDGSNRLAKIIEKGGQAPNWNYYIHYHDFNRRMDEWIDISRIVSYPSVANKLQPTGHHGSHAPNAHNPPHPTHKSPSSSHHKTHGGHGNNTGQDAHNKLVSTVADLDHDEHEGLDEASLLEHESITKVKNIKYVQLGQHIMECWYFSPFPREYYPNGFIECMYFCEFSLRFFKSKRELIRYQSQSTLKRHPPGNEIYRDEHVSMFELDGAVEKYYCQNLCYFAKLFLDHKTLYWDVDPFLFYVLCTRDERGYHPVGYFSKEK